MNTEHDDGQNAAPELRPVESLEVFQIGAHWYREALRPERSIAANLTCVG